MTRLLRAGVAAAALSATALVGAPARAADPDPWFGKDKALHFGACATIAAGGYAISATQFDARYPPLLIGGGLAIAAGAGKELLDMTGFGDPSWRDFTWDVIGAVVGLGVAWGIDLVVRGTGPEHPLFVAPIGTKKAGLVIAF